MLHLNNITMGDKTLGGTLNQMGYLIRNKRQPDEKNVVEFRFIRIALSSWLLGAEDYIIKMIINRDEKTLRITHMDGRNVFGQSVFKLYRNSLMKRFLYPLLATTEVHDDSFLTQHFGRRYYTSSIMIPIGKDDESYYDVNKLKGIIEERLELFNKISIRVYTSTIHNHNDKINNYRLILFLFALFYDFCKDDIYQFSMTQMGIASYLQSINGNNIYIDIVKKMMDGSFVMKPKEWYSRRPYKLKLP